MSVITTGKVWGDKRGKDKASVVIPIVIPYYSKLVGFSLSWGAAIVVLLDPFLIRSEIIDWTEGRVSSLYFWIRLRDWSEAIHDFAIRAK